MPVIDFRRKIKASCTKIHKMKGNVAKSEPRIWSTKQCVILVMIYGTGNCQCYPSYNNLNSKSNAEDEMQATSGITGGR